MTKKNNDLVSNRKAFHDYEILDTFEAGIALEGTEVKSLKEHNGSLKEAYVTIKKNELWLINATIAIYKFGNLHNHEDKRERKLLMHKNEINKLHRLTQEKGLTIVPLALYLKRGKIKIKIATAKGRKSYDKRHKLKEEEHKKDINRAIKNYS
jgi:SsrA-binding protein